jgi:hypothetical protein
LQIISLPTSYYARWIVVKDRKNDCIVWDRLTVPGPTDIVINQVIPVAQEAPVTFGHVKSQIYMDIYNTRISYLTATIPLGLADVKACFRYPRIHADFVRHVLHTVT